MARCNSCSAPLPANINRCRYCNIRNDVDIHKKHHYSIQTKHSDRMCPHCETSLQTIKLDFNGPFLIERCKSCFGLFFDNGELETLLENSILNVSNINLTLIKNINKDRYQSEQKVKYVKCPVCSIFMNRVNYGHRSGVIIDQCKKHGIWLDSGEVTHLMEWKKAGGELLNTIEKSKPKKKKPKREAILEQSSYPSRPQSIEAEIVETICTLVYDFFRH